MKGFTIFKIAAAGLALTAAASVGSAATVLCPNSLGPVSGGITATRQVEVTGALAGGECYYTLGNFNADDFSTWLGSSYTLIEKDIAPNGGGTGSLNYTGSTSGTWAMTSNLWATYAEIFIAFHFGNGSGDPDSFIVELNPTDLSGLWALIPTSLANGLSNIYLIGRGTPTATSSGPTPSTGGVPGPTSTLTLMGLGLLGLGYQRRLRKTK